jgi:hypothetical protein
MSSEFPEKFDGGYQSNNAHADPISAIQHRIGILDTDDPDSLTYEVRELQAALSNGPLPLPTDFANVNVNVQVGGTTNQQLGYNEQFFLSARLGVAPFESGASGALTSAPTLVGPSSPIATVEDAGVGGVDTTLDDLPLQATVLVTDQLGTEVLAITGTGDIPQVGPNQSGTIDWATATTNPIAGSDLTWDSGNQEIFTTNGGVFTVSITWQFSWD